MFPCIALIFHLPDADLLPEVLRFLLPGKSAVQIKQQGRLVQFFFTAEIM